MIQSSQRNLLNLATRIGGGDKNNGFRAIAAMLGNSIKQYSVGRYTRPGIVVPTSFRSALKNRGFAI